MPSRTIRRVLVVEDNRALLRTLTDALARRYPEVRGCRTLAECRGASDGWQPDLALLDVALPDGSAAEVLDLLGQGATAPVIVAMSGEATPDQSFALAERGVRA